MLGGTNTATNHDSIETPDSSRENARRLCRATAAPRGTKPTLLSNPETIQFHIDTDITTSTVKSGENAASVKTFLVNKLMPGALDFFTVHSPEGSSSQPSGSKAAPRVCHTMDVRCKHRKVWILPIKDDMRYQSTIFTLYTKGHLG